MFKLYRIFLQNFGLVKMIGKCENIGVESVLKYFDTNKIVIPRLKLQKSN